MQPHPIVRTVVTMPAHHGWSVTATAPAPAAPSHASRASRPGVGPTVVGATRRDDVVRQLPCRKERSGRDAA